MAFVPVPKDLSKVKTKAAFNLTKRQLICFGTAALVGVPVYFLSRGLVGTTAAVLIMIALMLPFFFLAMYEKDGQSAEIVLRNMLRVKLWPGRRPYLTENLYEYLEEEGKAFVEEETAAQSAKSARSEQSTSQPAKQSSGGDGSKTKRPRQARESR